MQRMTKKERWEAANVAFAEGRFGSLDQANDWLTLVEAAARKLHAIYVRQCNGYGPRHYAYPDRAEARDAKAETNERLFLKATFRDHGLGLYLNDDPRGNPVGILTPKTGKYNTMGGAECGWRL